ncbi:hypothetical protein [Candidatus Methanocrinis natronophilus]|uniref:Uncharacterized protein n=1 Tax=Candidatus Methanocrinis natronophilus TaxID=3033396 RepID=A0ABT5XAD8_9EURY|nr:hypothetical protein [Candidatus Methanocrinis natronophilus]MDF0591663.1 hypothetical protein [Candidatus Methanocrinis natronophilus]
MAGRSEITVNELSGAFKNHETADTIDKTNDHVIPDAWQYRRLLLSFELTAATADDSITIKAGDGEPAFRRSLGDLVFEAEGGDPGAERVVVGPIESARYLQSDGSILIDVAGDTIAGTIDAYALP